jgi:hypothetical protein
MYETNTKSVSLIDAICETIKMNPVNTFTTFTCKIKGGLKVKVNNES